MTITKTLCLNMIVKNETKNLERCLGAVADHISCWVIGDTGSTDGTQDFIKSFFAAREIPAELHSFPFHNWEQARNAALDCAYASPLAFDYLLFADADMELVVEDRNFREKLDAPGYLIQRADSGLDYWNARLVQRNIGARYHGVTHEYLDVPGGAQELRGVWYKDHASGLNRVDKFERDIRLLSQALEKEPENVRYWYYLAQSYRDAGQTEEAAKAYGKRAGMGGWEEEAWSARLQEARCLRQLGDESGFLRQALAAFNQRPRRAEPLYDLARFYREKGMNDASLLFSEAGIAMPRPTHDTLLVEDFVYKAGFQEEFSIAANYSREVERKDRGFAACDWLALNRDAPHRTRELAGSNLFFYVQPAATIMPSFKSRPIEFAPPDGFRGLNPSVARHGERIALVQRCANFVVTDGRYAAIDGGSIRTRNFLLIIDDNLNTKSTAEILPPLEMPAPLSTRIQGFEDARLFSWRDALWFSACFRELNAEALAEQALLRIDESEPGECRAADLRMLRPDGPRQAEKNWMPWVRGDSLQFIYHCDPTRIVDAHGRTLEEAAPPIAADQFRGGSQAIPFDAGWLALVHEVSIRDRRRHYQHRFVWFDGARELRRVSRPFYFERRGIEYAAGLARHPDGNRLVVSYGVEDAESRVAAVEASDVLRLLADADALPSGAVSTKGHAKPALAVSDRAVIGKREATAYRCGQTIAVQSPLSEVAVNGHALDQRACPVRAKVFICTMERTGSYLLCRAMIHHGIGVPHEYFNNLNASIIGPRFSVSELRDGRLLASDSAARRAYISALQERRTINGIFSAKIHWYQYARFLNNPEGLELLQGGYFIHLCREDLLAQAISFHMSKLTGRWGVDDVVRTRPTENPQFFDNDLIASCLEAIANDDREWRLFFARNGITPLTISYEQMKDDLAGTLDKIITSFGLPVRSTDLTYVEPAPTEFREPGTPSKSEIRDHFTQTNRKIITGYTPGEFPTDCGVSKRPDIGAREGRAALVDGAIDEVLISEPLHNDDDERNDANASPLAPTLMYRKQRREAEKAVLHAAGPPKPGEATAGSLPPGIPGAKLADRTICLCMIVKNEAPVIRRCLDSVRSIIDHWVIVDTGSTDGTQDIIRDHMKVLPGELHQRPWRDFAHNRSEALTLARPHGDYSLIIDADDALEIPQGFQLPKLAADSYMLDIQDTSIRYQRTQLVRNTLPWRYQGVLHEYLTCEGAGTAGHLPIVMWRNHDGARRRDPNTYRKDAAILENALRTETDPFLISRYTFYLAQSYRDCGEKQKSVEAYLRRAELGYWDQEIFFSLYKAAQLKEELGHDRDEVLALYLRASHSAPNRAEALHGASRLCRYANRYEQGREIAERGLPLSPRADGLFVETWIYEYGLLDEFAVNAYWSERYEECLEACRCLLREGKMPEGVRDRVKKNADFALEKLQAAAQPKEAVASPSSESDAFAELLRAARLKERLALPNDEVITAYVEATAARPTRAEALHGAARFCRIKEIFERGYQFARRGLTIAYPQGAPGVEEWIYEFGLLDELAINAYWTERYAECVDACDRLLGARELPASDRDRALKNKQFAIEKLAEARSATTGAGETDASVATQTQRLPESKGSSSSAQPPTVRQISDWVPREPAGGTEIMVETLRRRLGAGLDRINLQINGFRLEESEDRPLVVWFHHNVNEAAVQWLRDKEKVRRVARFVFVSNWQKDRYIERFELHPELCTVLRNATDVAGSNRRWAPGRPLKMAYTSVPYRGLSVLLDAWDRLRAANAELHIWSSIKLYGPGFDDEPYRKMYERALSWPGVEYHGIIPNADLQKALREIDFLSYPSSFEETSCLAAIEAMAAGCRVICPTFGALPETTGGFARLYPYLSDRADHAKTFAEVLAEEIRNPWGGDLGLAEAQQDYARETYSWPVRVAEWVEFIDFVAKQINC